MVQCHICQLWAHFQCVDEAESDIIGSWSCKNCRKLHIDVAALGKQLSNLQRDMDILLKHARSFSNIQGIHKRNTVNSSINVCDVTPDINDNTNNNMNIMTILHRNCDVNVDASLCDDTQDSLDNNSRRYLSNLGCPKQNVSKRFPVNPRRLITLIEVPPQLTVENTQDTMMISHNIDTAMVNTKAESTHEHGTDGIHQDVPKTKTDVEITPDHMAPETAHKVEPEVTLGVNTLSNSETCTKEDVKTTIQQKPSDASDKAPRRSRYIPYVPMTTHDIYMGGLPRTYTRGAVLSHLRDVGVKNII